MPQIFAETRDEALRKTARTIREALKSDERLCIVYNSGEYTAEIFRGHAKEPTDIIKLLVRDRHDIDGGHAGYSVIYDFKYVVVGFDEK